MTVPLLPLPTTGAIRASAALIALAGCAFHDPGPDPLDPVADLAAERDRRAGRWRPDPGEPLTLEAAARWLAADNPRLHQARAVFRAARAIADVATPWPDPVVTAGPRLGFGPDVEGNEVVPFGSLSWAVPLGDRLARQDDVNHARALAAHADLLGTAREVYLELRARYVELAVARARRALRAEILDAARRTAEVGRRLVEAGTATAVDVAAFRTEHARARADLLAADLAVAEAEADLAALFGADPGTLGTLPGDALPSLPDAVPGRAALHGLLAREHPGLLRQRAEYAVAERRLQLEVAEQYPDLTLGTDLGREVGEDKTVLGLGLGLALPLFDRNHPGVVAARGRRGEARARYEAEAARALGAVDRARRAVALAAQRHRALREEVLPAAEESLAAARGGLAAGTAGALELLEAERALRRTRLEVMAAELAGVRAWLRLERAVGHPLVTFGTEARVPLDLTAGEGAGR